MIDKQVNNTEFFHSGNKEEDVSLRDLLDEEDGPYFEDGKWRIPYLMYGEGGSGGGVGELSHETKKGVLELYFDKVFGV